MFAMKKRVWWPCEGNRWMFAMKERGLVALRGKQTDVCNEGEGLVACEGNRLKFAMKERVRWPCEGNSSTEGYVPLPGQRTKHSFNKAVPGQLSR